MVPACSTHYYLLILELGVSDRHVNHIFVAAYSKFTKFIAAPTKTFPVIGSDKYVVFGSCNVLNYNVYIDPVFLLENGEQ